MRKNPKKKEGIVRRRQRKKISPGERWDVDPILPKSESAAGDICSGMNENTFPTTD